MKLSNLYQDVEEIVSCVIRFCLIQARYKNGHSKSKLIHSDIGSVITFCQKNILNLTKYDFPLLANY